MKLNLLNTKDYSYFESLAFLSFVLQQNHDNVFHPHPHVFLLILRSLGTVFKVACPFLPTLSLPSHTPLPSPLLPMGASTRNI